MKVVLVAQEVADELMAKVKKGVEALSVGMPEVGTSPLHVDIRPMGSRMHHHIAPFLQQLGRWTTAVHVWHSSRVSHHGPGMQ